MTKTRAIYKLFDEASDHLSNRPAHVDSSTVNQIISSLYSPGESFQYIFDFALREFIHVSDSVEPILGIDNNNFTPEELIQLFHPDDLNYFLHCEEIAKYFLFSFIHKAQLPEYKVSYQLRIKNNLGMYKLFLHQTIAFTWDDDFKMSSALVNHSDISHITNVNNNKVSFINIRGGKSYYGIGNIEDLHNLKSTDPLVSDRELEILSLIAEGFSSADIASYLYISMDTVATHRKNILRKTAFKTIPQAVTHFVREGLI